MTQISAFGIFCEDVREEKSGGTTIVGATLDNVYLPGFPGMLAKFALFARLNLPLDAQAHAAHIYITMPDGNRVLVGHVPEDAVATAIEDARRNEAPFAGIITHMIAAPFPLDKPSRVTADLTYGDEQFILGFVNFRQGPPPAA
ncbi:DUF6941 family protein [Novosphingobium humi]|uniref:Uncharacterized protein n=1 Tax=Novosphingobium humi TaxID=2282397 RepID=A0ABY7TTJ1_9SPHN|nr:hypothetical protein [Novosphingobium humi]WCT75926.1 hypothetical protein PQ457_08080 [Novosphingobium humi]